jgi:glycosyltransferase involved in cell wall biosynthesis
MLFEVKAGVFDSWYQTTGRGNRWMIRQIMKTSALVLVEGRRYVEFVRSEFGRPAVYFPNHVPTGEVSASVAGILNDKVIRIVFIGFCYEGKGVFELVRGCCLAAGAGVDLKLTLVGQEELKFGRWLDELDLPPNLEIERMGRQPHRKVLRILTEAECFCLPSKHPGEGHYNSVIEAMMLGKCLIISSAGFLPDILSNEEAYFLRGVAEEEVARSIEELASSRETARAKAARARELLLSSFTTGELYPRLAEHYAELLSSVGRR